MDSQNARAMPVLLALASMWGGSFLFIKYILEGTDPLEVALGRIVFGALAVVAFVLITRRRLDLSPGLIARVSVMSVFNNIIPFTLIPIGEEHISSGTASILNGTVPIFTMVVAVMVLDDERLSPPKVAGILLAFFGVGVLTGDDALDITSAGFLGELAVVGAAMSYGVGTVYSRTVLKGRDSVNIVVLQLVMSAILIVPIVFAANEGRPDFSLDTRGYLSVIALGVAGTGAAYVAYFWLIANIGSVRATLVTYIVPIIAVVLGWLVLDESIGVNTVLGGLLIVGGVACAMRGQAPATQPRRERTAAVAAGR